MNEFDVKKVLVTGGCGFIGSHVVDLLVDYGCSVSVFDNLSFGKREFLNKHANFFLGDLINREQVKNFFTEHSFDAVVHLAAIHFIPYCNKYPDKACRVNVEGTQNLLDAIKSSGGVRRLFIASTAAVYPDLPGKINESVYRAPMDVYGMVKSANEEQAAIFSHQNEIHVSIGRFFNAVGGRETNDHLVPSILNRISASNEIEIGNITPKRDYVDVRDMSRAVLSMLFKNCKRIDTCNIGSGLSYNVNEIVDIFSKIHGRKILLKSVSELIRKVERQNLQSDINRIFDCYGWSPSFSIHDSLEYAYKWYFNEKRGYLLASK